MNVALVDLDDLRRLIAEALPVPTALMTRDEVAGLLRVHARDLRRLVLEGAFPPGFKVGRRLRWRRETVEAWIREAERAATGGGTRRNRLDASRTGRLHVAGMATTGAPS